MSANRSALIECRDEGDFHAAFREDLLGLRGEGIILSPFLRSARAAEYYPLFGGLVRRDARIIVYTRPEQESAGESRSEHARVSASLRGIGVDVRHRPRMHEKLAVLDREVLWFGSLNILSHGSSTESMLKFEDPDLIGRILVDLRLDVIADGGHEEDGSADAPDPAGAGLVRDLDPPCLCPRCGATMVVRQGAHTRLACPDVGCGFEFDPHLSRWLLSARGRRRLS